MQLKKKHKQNWIVAQTGDARALAVCFFCFQGGASRGRARECHSKRKCAPISLPHFPSLYLPLRPTSRPSPRSLWRRAGVHQGPPLPPTRAPRPAPASRAGATLAFRARGVFAGHVQMPAQTVALTLRTDAPPALVQRLPNHKLVRAWGGGGRGVAWRGGVGMRPSIFAAGSKTFSLSNRPSTPHTARRPPPPLHARRLHRVGPGGCWPLGRCVGRRQSTLPRLRCCWRRVRDPRDWLLARG